MSRYAEIEKALRKLIADYESEIHDNYDGTSFLSHRMAEVDDAKDALALPEDDSLTAKMREAGIDPDADTMHDVYMTVEQRAAFNRLCDDAMRYRALPKPPKGEV